MKLETEVRSFISEKQYEDLLTFFTKKAKLIKNDFQETIYFDCDKDLRLQRNDSHAKIWLKEGKIHDNSREEIEIIIKREDFEKTKKLFKSLDYKTEIVWHRKRKQFLWEDDITVCLDYTEGYGYIIELEKIVEHGESKSTYNHLVQKMNDLGVETTPKEEFQEKFEYYKKNWKKLISEKDN